MNIGCIYSIQTNNNPLKPISINSLPFGISFVATSLQRAGFNPHIFVFTPRSDTHEILTKFIKKNKPQLFCLTAVASQISFIIKVAEEIKKIDPTIFIIIGGVHATLNPTELIKTPFFDAICIGEGEIAICNLALQIQKDRTNISGIPNLWIKKPNGLMEKNAPQDFIQDLDSLPFINREIWHPWVYDIESTEQSILISRGCPNKCSYCSNHILSKIANGKYVRFRTPSNILAEIEEIINHYPQINSIWLESETISMNLSYCSDLLEVLSNFNKKRENKITFRTNISLSKKILNEDFFQKLAIANVNHVNIGLESGSEYIRNAILRRPKYSNDEIIYFCQLAKKYDIKVLFFVIIGLPEESVKDYFQTIDCIRKCAPDVVSKYLYYPYPGTDLFDMAKNKGYLSDFSFQQSGEERIKPILSLPDFSKGRQRIEFIIFEYRVFKGRIPPKQILRYVLQNIFITFPNYFNMIRKIRKR